MSVIDSHPPGDEVQADFDRFAARYDEVLNSALRISGEELGYFAQRRIEWLGQLLAELEFTASHVLDYGCGTGTSVPLFFKLLKAQFVTGLDVSAESLAIAARLHGSSCTEFKLVGDDFQPAGIDLAFCNGVFHHIPTTERFGAVCRVYERLRAGGLFAFWENNPWSLGARYCMWVNPVDSDAQMVSPAEARVLLQEAGFTILKTNYLFIFPRLLANLRWLEPKLCRWPLGAQYIVLAQKPPLASGPMLS